MWCLIPWLGCVQLHCKHYIPKARYQVDVPSRLRKMPTTLANFAKTWLPSWKLYLGLKVATPFQTWKCIVQRHELTSSLSIWIILLWSMQADMSNSLCQSSLTAQEMVCWYRALDDIPINQSSPPSDSISTCAPNKVMPAGFGVDGAWTEFATLAWQKNALQTIADILGAKRLPEGSTRRCQFKTILQDVLMASVSCFALFPLSLPNDCLQLILQIVSAIYSGIFTLTFHWTRRHKDMILLNSSLSTSVIFDTKPSLISLPLREMYLNAPELINQKQFRDFSTMSDHAELHFWQDSCTTWLLYDCLSGSKTSSDIIPWHKTWLSLSAELA